MRVPRDGGDEIPRGAPSGGVPGGGDPGPEAEGAAAAREGGRRLMAAGPAVPGAAPPTPQDPLLSYYRTVRQANLDLAERRYKTEVRFRTPQYIRGRGTTAGVDEEGGMGGTHCFDNCAFEAI